MIQEVSAVSCRPAHQEALVQFGDVLIPLSPFWEGGINWPVSLYKAGQGDNSIRTTLRLPGGVAYGSL